MKYFTYLQKRASGVFDNHNERLIHEVNLLYKLLPSTSWIDMAVIVLIAGLLMRYVELNQLILWCLLAFIIMSIRICIGERFNSIVINEKNVKKWFDLFLVAATLYGVMWSFTAIILVPSENPVAAAFAIFTLCILTALVTAVSSINTSVFAIYVVTTLWPYSFYLIASNSYPQSIIGIAAIIVSLIILIMGTNINNFYKGMIDLELKNLELYEELRYESKRLNLVENSLLNNILDEEIAEKIRKQSLDLKRSTEPQNNVINSADNSINSYLQMLDNKIKSQLQNSLYFVNELEQANLSESLIKNVKIINKLLSSIVKTIDRVSMNEESIKQKLTEINFSHGDYTEINIRRMINYITHEIPLGQKVKSIRVDKHVDKMTPTKIYGPKDALNEILSNLITNAVKYNNGGNVNVSVENLNNNEGHLLLQFTVTDSGAGMDGETIEYLKNDTIDKSERYPGLTVVKHLISKYANNLIVNSNPDIGTNIMFQMAFDTNNMVLN
jgi:signal transduction histidine kinase